MIIKTKTIYGLMLLVPTKYIRFMSSRKFQKLENDLSGSIIFNLRKSIYALGVFSCFTTWRVLLSTILIFRFITSYIYTLDRRIYEKRKDFAPKTEIRVPKIHLFSIDVIKSIINHRKEHCFFNRLLLKMDNFHTWRFFFLLIMHKFIGAVSYFSIYNRRSQCNILL